MADLVMTARPGKVAKRTVPEDDGSRSAQIGAIRGEPARKTLTSPSQQPLSLSGASQTNPFELTCTEFTLLPAKGNAKPSACAEET